MRTFPIVAASFVLLGVVAACSDGSGLSPGATGTPSVSSSGSGSTPVAGTPAVIPVAGSTATGGTGSTPDGGGSGTLGGSATTSGSSTGGMTTGGVMTGGGTGSTPGGAPAGGSGSGGSDAHSGPFKILVLSTALDFPHDSIPICSLMLGVEGAFNFLGLKTTAQPLGINGPNLRAYVESKSGDPGSGRNTQPPNLGVTPDAMMPPGTKPGSQWTAVLAKHDMSDFTDDNLKNYAMVFACNPTGTVFTGNANIKDDKTIHMLALQHFVEGGGAWGGVHSATDFEKANGFPWFTNTLVGGWFDHHENDGTSGTVQVVATFTQHPVMRGVPATWSTKDEWYYMNRDIGSQPGFQIIERMASDNRPVTWIKEVGQGRMFYTIRGHNMDRYDNEPAFRQLVLNGILWATHRLE